MQMYIGNATHHILNFIYRVPGQPRSRTLAIPIGSQVKCPDDLSTAAVDSIIKQHTKYGFTSANEIASVKHFTGTIFSLEKPIPSMKIEELMLFNRDELIELGKEIREDACIVSHNIAEDSVDEIGRQGGMVTPLNNMQIEIVEQNPDPRNENQIAEGYKVNRNTPTQQQKHAQRRNRR